MCQSLHDICYFAKIHTLFYSEMICNFNSSVVLEGKQPVIQKFKFSRLKSDIDNDPMKTMETTWLHYYDIIYKVASLTGMWPSLKSRIKIFRVILLTIIMLTILVPQVN